MRVVSDPSTDWESFGETDPYWAVLTEQKFRNSNIDTAARAEFFASGEAHVDWVVETIRATIDESFAPRRALDFGCGVGRVLIPLAKRYPGAVGIDVAQSMLREARRNIDAQAVSAELILGDDRLSRVSGAFDFIHSYIVFQHIPPARGLRLVAALLDLLNPGGAAALHFTYAAPLSIRQRLLRWLRHHTPMVTAATNLAKGRSASAPYMELYEYDLGRLFEIFRASGCADFHLRLTDHGGLMGAFMFFRKNLPAGRPPTR
ncbi:MAG TPA: class I SAM-dependent methyltransferase [Gemmatimonadaceae bacterium]|nr:class I SAM-dependent methyltransferase [Gemmatimonadaceae bacterium]